MGQEKILNLFFENPSKEFQLRGISRILLISKTSVSYNIDKLMKEGIVLKIKKGVFPSYVTNDGSPKYKLLKQQYAVRKIAQSGLISFLEKELTPTSIILFGSFAKGEYDAKSDIDIYVQASNIKIALDPFEKKLGHNINILFEPNPMSMSSELLNNIVNGIKLGGYLKLK